MRVKKAQVDLSNKTLSPAYFNSRRLACCSKNKFYCAYGCDLYSVTTTDSLNAFDSVQESKCFTAASLIQSLCYKNKGTNILVLTINFSDGQEYLYIGDSLGRGSVKVGSQSWNVGSASNIAGWVGIVPHPEDLTMASSTCCS